MTNNNDQKHRKGKEGLYPECQREHGLADTLKTFLISNLHNVGDYIPAVLSHLVYDGLLQQA